MGAVMRLTPIEKIAREYCWAGFARPELAGCTKAAYWKRLSNEKRQEYIREASQFCYRVRRLGRAWMLEIIDGEIE
jgi:hypothetical protein